jgi:hypothetical protein
MELFYLLALFLPVPLVLYVIGLDRGRGAWGLVFRGFVQRGSSAYRAAEVPVWKEGRAPLAVHAAAVSSFILGQMIVPGALCALVGLLMLAEMLGRPWRDVEPLLIVLILSAPTGLYVAGSLLSTGGAMLRREADASTQARRAARWAIGHNVALLFAIGACALGYFDAAYLGPVAYALVSIAHALLLLRAARALDAYADAQAKEPAPAAVNAG